MHHNHGGNRQQWHPSQTNEESQGCRNDTGLTNAHTPSEASQHHT